MSGAGIRVGIVDPPRRRAGLDAIDLIETTAGRDLPPATRGARRLRSATPGRVAFAVRLSHLLWEQPRAGAPLPGDAGRYGRFARSDENAALWDRCLGFARILEAEALVLATPPDFTPARPNVEALAAFLASVARPAVPLAWEPRGPWEPARAAAVARDLSLVLAVDPLRDAPPPGPVAYLRLGAFAALGSRLGTYDLERIADAALGRDSTFCVFDTSRALDDAKALRELLAGSRT